MAFSRDDLHKLGASAKSLALTLTAFGEFCQEQARPGSKCYSRSLLLSLLSGVPEKLAEAQKFVQGAIEALKPEKAVEVIQTPAPEEREKAAVNSDELTKRVQDFILKTLGASGSVWTSAQFAQGLLRDKVFPVGMSRDQAVDFCDKCATALLQQERIRRSGVGWVKVKGKSK